MTLIFVKLPKKERTAERTHAYSHIECNVCQRKAPQPCDHTTARGLAGEGWLCRGGVHLCPDHVSHEGLAPRSPEYRGK